MLKHDVYYATNCVFVLILAYYSTHDGWMDDPADPAKALIRLSYRNCLWQASVGMNRSPRVRRLPAHYFCVPEDLEDTSPTIEEALADWPLFGGSVMKGKYITVFLFRSHDLAAGHAVFEAVGQELTHFCYLHLFDISVGCHPPAPSDIFSFGMSFRFCPLDMKFPLVSLLALLSVSITCLPKPTNACWR